MQSETLAQEFARLVKEYHEGDDHTKPEAWNLLADYAVDNADAISAALSEKQTVEVNIKPLEWEGELGTEYAVSILGLYSVWEGHYRLPGAHAGIRADDPKQAAQKHLERIIRSALVDVPAVERSQPSTKPLPDQEYLCSILRYEWETGRLFWKRRESVPKGSVITWNKAHAGQEAFTYSDRRGYKIGKIDGEGYQAHRVIWKMVHGRDPDCIDHIDHNPSNNRIGNLRSCSNADNSRNYRISVSGTSKYRGVYRLKGSKTWIAQMADGKGGKRNLGTFDSEEDAARAYDAAARQYHGEFATLNFTSPPLSREGEDNADASFMTLVSRYGDAPTQEGFDQIYRRYLSDCERAATRSGSATAAKGNVDGQ